MSREYTPVGIACNLKCEYCYQDSMRDASNINAPLNWEKAKIQLTSKFSVFGGEPLLTSISHLEEVFKYGFETFGGSSIQTNGVLITDEHIELFKRFKVGVGLSLDGPAELNGARCDVPTTLQIHLNLEALCRAEVIPSLIVTLNRHNASFEAWEQMEPWLEYLESLGIKHINLHILEVEKGREAQALSDVENYDAFTRFYEFSKRSKMTFQPFEDIRRLLKFSNPEVSCIWNHCDPLTTNAVQGVGPDGTKHNCGRTNKDGVNWVKGDKPGFERYLILRQTSQEHGGCKDCQFFIFCKGQCPGTAIDNDWRNRTVHCLAWFSLFKLIEADILRERFLPISRDTTLYRKLEKELIRKWTGAISDTCEDHGDAHGDSPHGDSPHGDAHGDSPHGDEHGDSRTEGVPVSWR